MQLCTLRKFKRGYEVGNVALKTADIFKILGHQRFCSRRRAGIVSEYTTVMKRDWFEKTSDLLIGLHFILLKFLNLIYGKKTRIKSKMGLQFE